MAFLAPWFIAGLFAVALPILLHLRKNRPKDTVAFSSLMFLDASPPVTKRRSRLQDILLLILRCLAIALLILAFTRPFFPAKETPAATGGSVMNFILIDTSASMRGEPLERALETADDLIENFPAGDWIAVATFSDRLRPFLGPARARELTMSERKSSARAVLAEVKADWNATRLDTSLLAAVAAAGEETPVEIHVIGDFQKGAAVEQLRGESWPDQLRVIPHPIAPKDNWTNAGVRILPADGKIQRARVINSEGSAKSDFTLAWAGAAETTNVSVPAGESAVFDAPPGLAGEGIVSLTGDDFPFDNEAAWTTPVKPVARVWNPDATQPADTSEGGYFLSRALQTTPEYSVEILPQIPAGSPALTIASGALDDASIAKLRDFLKAGGTALFTVRDTVSAAILGKITGHATEETREATVNDHARFGEIDFKSPVFAPFADARYSDFSGIRFWKYRVLAPELVAKGATVARFDTGDPAWLSFPVEKGTLHVLTTTWRPADSQLALTTKFSPLLHAMLDLPASKGGPFLIGDANLPAGVDSPGIHRVGDSLFTVQLDLSESELAPVPESELRALGLPLDPRPDIATTAARAVEISNTEQEGRQRIGWWLLVAATAFFLAETAWAALTGGRATPATS